MERKGNAINLVLPRPAVVILAAASSNASQSSAGGSPWQKLRDQAWASGKRHERGGQELPADI
jgi:hypothetical protein